MAIFAGGLTASLSSLKTARLDPLAALGEGGRFHAGGGPGSRKRWRFQSHAVILVLEMGIGVAAVAVALGMGLAYRVGLDDPYSGFTPDLLAFSHERTLAGREFVEVLGFTKADLAAIAAFPGIKAVTSYQLTAIDLSFGRYWENGKRVDPLREMFGRQRPRGDRLALVECGPDFLRFFGCKIRAGSFILSGEELYPRRVCVLNPAAAKAFFGTTDCLGRVIAFYNDEKLKVIGITEPVGRLPDEAGVMARWLDWPIIFLPFLGKSSWTGARTVLARLKPGVRPSGAIASLRSLLAARYPKDNIKVYSPYARLSNNALTKYRQVMLWTVGGLGALLLLVAGLGIAGLSMLNISRRRREIAIRMAMGAAPGRIFAHLMGEALAVAAGGAMLGLGLARFLAYLFRAERYLAVGVVWRTIGWAFVFALSVGMAAAFHPARRGIDLAPAEALRE